MAEPTDKDTRGPVNLRIKFRSESLQQFIERYGVDVSRGGIFIRTREPLPVGTRLKLDFQLVDTVPLFQGDGTVVWIREHDPARAGVTPGMGVRFDRLTTESQTTLDTILEEKIRLQQSGVAPGSVAKAGAGMAVRRPSGAFATLESAGARPAGPPPLPVEVKLDTPIAPPPTPSASIPGAAPVAAIPTSSRTGPHATVSSSIFTRPRTTSGMRAVPVPSALFEAPTAADIDKALSVLEEKGGPAPPFTPTIVKPEVSQPLGEDEPTKVFDSTAQQEFSVNEAVTGPAQVVPEDGIPILAEGEGDLTQRRDVDPADGQVRSDAAVAAALAGAAGKLGDKKGEAPPPVPGAAAVLDAPLASLVDSGSAPSAKPPTPPPMKPGAPATAKPAASATKTSSGIPMRITTDRPAATESGRFRSDTRYKRARGKGLGRAVAVVIVAGGLGAGGLYLKQRHDRNAAAEAQAAAAAAEAAAKAAPPPAPPPAPTPSPGAETNPGAPANPTEGAAAAAAAGSPEKPIAEAKTEAKADKPDKPEKADVGKPAATEKSARAEEGSSPAKSSGARKRERAAAAAAKQAAAEKSEESAGAGEKRAGGEEAGKAGGEAAKETGKEATKSAESGKAADSAKPADTGKPAEGDKAGDTAKPTEAAAAPAVTDRPTLKITSSPAGAQVVIDGVPVGTTPFSSRDVTSDGMHAISVKKEGFETHERTINPSDWARGKGGAQTLKFNVKMKRAAGEKPAGPAETGDKKPSDGVEILTPSEP